MPRAPLAVARRVLTSPWALAVGFVLVHAWLVRDAWWWGRWIFGDVELYEYWARLGLDGGWWPVLDADWVYPVGALVPVTLPALLTSTTAAYSATYAALVVLLDAVALVVLARARPRGVLAAWFWLAFLLALGPITFGRLDGVAAPLILVAVVLASRRPAVATAVATFGAWVKIAPAAVVVSLFTTTRRPWRDVVLPGAVVSAVVVGLALLGGSGTRVLGVFGEQGDRGLQAESVAGTWFSLARLWDPTQAVEYSRSILTYEIAGAPARAVADAMNWALPVAVVLVAGLAWWAARRRPDARSDVFLLAVAAQLLALIVLNKVGSPQFVAWIGPPVAAGIALATRGHGRQWAPPAAGLLVVAALTQVLYPIAYNGFLLGDPWIVVLEAVRNVLVVALLVGAVVRLVRLGLGQPQPTPVVEPSLPRTTT